MATPTITPANYKANLASLWAMAHLVEEAPIAEMLAAADYADAVGSILNPTLYIQKAQALREDTEMLGALLHVQQVLGRIRQRKARA
jgi:hypothetical protein